MNGFSLAVCACVCVDQNGIVSSALLGCLQIRVYAYNLPPHVTHGDLLDVERTNMIHVFV